MCKISNIIETKNEHFDISIEPFKLKIKLLCCTIERLLYPYSLCEKIKSENLAIFYWRRDTHLILNEFDLIPSVAREYCPILSIIQIGHSPSGILRFEAVGTDLLLIWKRKQSHRCGIINFVGNKTKKWSIKFDQIALPDERC